MIEEEDLRRILKSSSNKAGEVDVWLAERGINIDAFWRVLTEGGTFLSLRAGTEPEDATTLMIMGFVLGWSVRDETTL